MSAAVIRLPVRDPVFHRCPTCGTAYTRRTWAQLRWEGWPEVDEAGNGKGEVRRCGKCGCWLVSRADSES